MPLHLADELTSPPQKESILLLFPELILEALVRIQVRHRPLPPGKGFEGIEFPFPNVLMIERPDNCAAFPGATYSENEHEGKTEA
jgi:hypothetical protein